MVLAPSNLNRARPEPRRPNIFSKTSSAKSKKCQACLEVFSNVKMFNLHECKAQLLDNVYFCKFCNIIFKNMVRKGRVMVAKNMWEQYMVETVYLMMIFLWHVRVLYATEKGGERATQQRDREGERQSVAAKGHGVGNKLDLWRKYLWQPKKYNPSSYQNEHLEYLHEFRWL